MNDNRKNSGQLSGSQYDLLENIPAMVFLITEKQQIIYANSAAAALLADKGQKEGLFSILSPSSQLQGNRKSWEISLDNTELELTIVPVESGDTEGLYWIFLRRIGKEKEALAALTVKYNKLKQRFADKQKECNENEKIRQQLTGRLNSLETHLQQTPAAGKMVGSSQALQELQQMVLQVAESDATILITGESGTGKELMANFIQQNSSRSNKPFLKINCNTISESLLESDLFGYEKGAFTGAAGQQKGKFEEVNGGTIFLDEIGDISPRMQAALLRVLQDGEIIRVGGNKTITVDVRIIAATNRNLQEMVSDGSFRLDLFYRLNIINISIPPLRERKEDIIDLTTHFIRKYRKAFGRKISFVPQPVLDRLLLHNWPGNIRELENVIQRAVLMTKDNTITEQELHFDSFGIKAPATNKVEGTDFAEIYSGQPLKDILATVEKKVITTSLKKHHGNVGTVSAELNIGKTALYDKMKRYDIAAKNFK